MEERYWKQFWETGKIMDYLYYKGMQVCSRVMGKHEGEMSGESDYSDRHGTCGSACWRI